MNTIIAPRLQLIEIEDQPWCPSWLRAHSCASLARMWRTSTSPSGSPSTQACDILLKNLGGLSQASKFTFVDACAGAGGPTPLMEATLNARLAEAGHKPVQFILTDLYPDSEAWKRICARSENIESIWEPVDAMQPRRMVSEGGKECRIFNLCFHHFDDRGARKVLRSAVQNTDAFFIFEMTHRTPTAFLNVAMVILSTFVFSLVDWWFSPLVLFFTYIIPLVPLYYTIDGIASCIRTRTPEETWRLLPDENEQDLRQWKFESGRVLVLPPFGTMYWYSGVKKNVD